MVSVLKGLLILLFGNICFSKSTCIDYIIQEYEGIKNDLGDIDQTLINCVYEKVFEDYESQNKIMFYLKKN